MFSLVSEDESFRSAEVFRDNVDRLQSMIHEITWSNCSLDTTSVKSEYWSWNRYAIYVHPFQGCTLTTYIDVTILVFLVTRFVVLITVHAQTHERRSNSPTANSVIPKQVPQSLIWIQVSIPATLSPNQHHWLRETWAQVLRQSDHVMSRRSPVILQSSDEMGRLVPSA